MKSITKVLVGITCLGFLGACSNEKMDRKESQMAESSMMESSSMEEKSNQMKEDMKEEKMMNEGKKAPDFTLMGVDGKEHKLSDYKGKKIYIKFWASWCSICLASLPETNELATMKEKDYEVLSIVAPDFNGEKSAEEFKKWYDSLEYKDLPVLLDQNGEVMQSYGIRSYPSSAFIGSDGVLVKTQVGFLSSDQIQESMKSIK